MESGGFFQTFLSGIQSGDPAIILIAISGILSLTFTFERTYRLFFNYAVDGSSFMFEVQKYILANDLDGAIRLCNGASGAALPKVIKAGLQRASRDQEQIQNAIDAASLEVIPKLERRLPYLALIANVATLFGLLGTITGLIKSFGAIAMADPSQRQAILGRGISEAMNATACGLVVAIFTMVMHAILVNKSAHIVADIDEFGVKLLDLLSARKFKHASQRED